MNKLLEVLDNLHDEVQGMRENGETDLRSVLHRIDSAKKEVKVKKAVLTGSFHIAQVDSDGYAVDDDFITFEKGMEVEVLREAPSSNEYKQYVIYSEQLGESTTVYERLLDFLK